MEIKGTINREIFRSTDGYVVCSVKRTDEAIMGDSIVVLKEGEELTISRQVYRFGGDWIEHKKYGKQFDAKYFYEELPSNTEALENYLSDYIKGIGSVKAKMIVEKFGMDLPSIIEQHPERLTEIKGINNNKIDKIVSSWKDNQQLRNISIWLSSKGVSPVYARKILKQWGEDSIKVLKDNPYRLVDINGVGFITADDLAHKILTHIDDGDRLKACIKYSLIETQSSDGNLALPRDDLLAKCNKYIKDGVIIALFNELIDTDQEFVTYNSLIYFKYIYNKEKFISSEIVKRVNGVNKYSGLEIKRPENVDDAQFDAIKNSFLNNVSIITGGGGVGKTHIVKNIVNIAEEHGLGCTLMCPTGKAAQVLHQKTGHPAGTIHKILGINKNNNIPCKLDVSFVIIDEISMVGLQEMNWVIESISESPNTHLVLVGDYQQLPSVSPGNILSDLINCGKIKTTFLTKIYRQSEHSYIPIYARDIARGIVPKISEDCTDFYFIKEQDKFKTRESIIALYKRMLEKGIDYKDIQIVSPMYKDEIGVIKLNNDIQSILHKVPENFYPRGDTKFYVGDRVIQLENNYENMVFNGDTGYITSINTEEKIVKVEFYNGNEIEYSSRNMQEITLAYASSVHKVQGAQSRFIILPISISQYIMLTKELLYTGVTRATEKVFIIGEEKAFKIAVSRSSIKGRFTSLITMING